VRRPDSGHPDDQPANVARAPDRGRNAADDGRARRYPAMAPPPNADARTNGIAAEE